MPRTGNVTIRNHINKKGLVSKMSQQMRALKSPYWLHHVENHTGTHEWRPQPLFQRNFETNWILMGLTGSVFQE